jgi:hypothetical protein
METVNQAFSPREFVLRTPLVEPAPSERDPGLDVHVIFTSFPRTRAALAAAASLAAGLEARVTILAAQVVPYPLPLEQPPVAIEFTEQKLWQMAAEQESGASVAIYLCRDRERTLRQVLRPESVVVIGGRKWWWPTEEHHLAKILRRDGHRVVLPASQPSLF